MSSRSGEVQALIKATQNGADPRPLPRFSLRPLDHLRVARIHVSRPKPIKAVQKPGAERGITTARGIHQPFARSSAVRTSRSTRSPLAIPSTISGTSATVTRP